MGALESAKSKFAHATGWMWGPPEIAVIETTNRCNLQCKMCYRLEHLKDTGDMDLALFERIVVKVKGSRHICCHGGGEPLLQPKIIDMIDCAAETCRPETLSITTNGTLLDQPMARRLAASKLTTLFVSMDGADKETFERIRGASSERVVENARYFKSISTIPTAVQFTVMRENLASLPALPELASSMGVDKINVQHLLIWNAQVAGWRILDVYEEFQDARERILQEAEKLGIECSVPSIGFMKACDLPFRQVYFNSRGELAPCCVAVHLTLQKNYWEFNGTAIRDWRRRVVRGDFPQECRQFCYAQ